MRDANYADEFIPECENNGVRCLARTWGCGVGGQCTDGAVKGQFLCKKHSTKNTHGFVNGPIPEDKLQDLAS